MIARQSQHNSGSIHARPAPGPARGRFLVGSLLDAQKSPLSFYQEAWQHHGDLVRFRYGFNKEWHFVGHPDDVERVLVTNWRNYPKGFFFNHRLKSLTGEGLVTNEGESWLRQRRLAQPAFHRERITALADVITDSTSEMLDEWRKKGDAPFDVTTEMMHLTLQIVGRALFGADLGGRAEDVYRAMTCALEYVHFRFFHPLSAPEGMPTPRNRRFHQAKSTLEEVAMEIITRRRREPENAPPHHDLLAMLLDARDEETGEGMSDRQLLDEVITIMFTGHETTAVILSWAWHVLSQHDDVREKLQAEVDTALNGRAPTVEDLPNLAYTKMVVEETMRLYPPVWAIPRQAKEADTLSGHTVAAGSSIVLLPYLTHRHPEFWPDPDKFDPERFAPGAEKSRPKYAYFPFGGGPRICIGQHFAMMEGQLILAAVMQQFNLKTAPNHKIEMAPVITLRPKNGIVMSLESRV